jgi:biotin carboxylase
MKGIFLVSAGAEAIPGILRAREMGLFVAVSDGNPAAPGFTLADHPVVASTYDVEATVEAARRVHREIHPLDGVLSVAADVPLTVASVAEELGLPGIPLESARLACDKLAMKERFLLEGVPIPWFREVGAEEELRRTVRDRGLPLVIKPVDGRGARGVLRLTEGVDLAWAFSEAHRHSPAGRVMVEEYLAGPQVSTESVLVEGEGATPGFSDRNYERLEHFTPYIIEDGGEQPSALSSAEQEAISRLTERAGLSLGVRTGTVKGDMVLTREGPRVIEIATRLSGGWFCTDQIPLATGVDLVGIAIRLALGEKVPIREAVPRRARGVAIRYLFPPPGRVTAIEGVEEVRRHKGIHRVEIFVRPGESIAGTTDHTKRAGCVITSGATREEAVARARAAVSSLRVATESP